MHVSPPSHEPSAAARAACAAWFGPTRPEFGPPLGGGFAGTPPLRVRPSEAAPWLVLKPFSPGTARERAEWVHALLRHLADAGIDAVPRPWATASGETLVTDQDGIHWELLPLVDGVAVAEPGGEQTAAALAALARLHAAAATLPGAPLRAGPAPAVTRRIERGRELAARSWRARRVAVGPGDTFLGAVGERWDRAIEIFEAGAGHRAVAAMAAWPNEPVALQAVLRDVWSPHVLFAHRRSARVVGIVDAHAAGIDTPVTDVARLLGSWCTGNTADPGESWPDALAAYAVVRPLTAAERGLVPFLHAAGVVGGLDNWFRWTCEERRTFAAGAIDRIDRLLDHLPAALDWLARQSESRV